MSLSAPGSVPWLLAHEMRLTWRAATSRQGTKKGAFVVWGLLLFGLVVLSLLLGVPLALYVERLDLAIGPLILLAIDMGLVLLWTLMLSQTLSQATVAFYERADLDLLLSSPLPARRILAVRTLAIAGNVLIFMGILATPLLLPMGLIANISWLAAYVMLGVLAVLASVSGVWLAMGLFATLGPRRTRTVAQLLAALAGAAIFLVSQSYNLMGKGQSLGMFRDIRALAESGRFDADSLASWPARATLGEPVALVSIIALTLVIFAMTAVALGRRFAANAATAAGASDNSQAKTGKDTARFTGGAFTALVRKEMRLLGRDPALLSQVLLQMLYLAPLAFLLIRNSDDAFHLSVAIGAGGVVFLSGQLAGSLGWITISGEDAPEMLTTAPVSAGRIRQAKVSAVLIPVFALLFGPLAVVLVVNPYAGLMSLLGCALTAVATCFIEIWRQRPGKRSEFRRRRGSAVLVPMIEVLVGLSFGAATSLAVMKMIPYSLIPLVVGMAIVWVLKPKTRIPPPILKAA